MKLKFIDRKVLFGWDMQRLPRGYYGELRDILPDMMCVYERRDGSVNLNNKPTSVI